ncbi:MAG: sulfotransferase [Acidimicrobiales bacterium]
MTSALQADELLHEAVAATGLEDFGPGDFQDGLAVLMESLYADADLTPAALDGVLSVFRRRLENRLRVEEWYLSNPAATLSPIEGPVDIMGLPRTGTTALANMMSLDTQFRALRGWEQSQPCPPPEIDTEKSDPRRLAAMAAEKNVAANLKAMHLYEVDATTEDSELLGMAFHGQQFTLPVYRYHQWWRDSDCTETFAYHRRVVALLGSNRPPNRWLFKAPHHKFHLEAIIAAYPDIRFVMTHRDPAKVVPSYTSMVSTIFPESCQERDYAKIGQEVSDHLRIGMQNCIAARERIGEERFIDVHHRELVLNPMATLERIYSQLDLEFTKEFHDELARWQALNAPGAHGVHSYTPNRFGLDAEQLRDDYRFYIDHFDVEIEN